MKKKEIVIVVLLIAFGFIYKAVEKGKINFAEDFSLAMNERSLVSVQYAEFPQKEMVFPAPEQITVDNPAGEVVIDRSADGQVHLWTFFRVYYADKADVEKISRQAKVLAGMEKNELKISADYPSAFPYKRLRVHFKLLIPEGAALAVSNHEGNISIRHGGKNILIKQEKGNVFLEDILAAVQLELRAGNLDAKNIAGKIIVDASHGDVKLENAAALQMQGKHGNIYLKNITNAVFIEHAFGDVTLDGAGQAEILGRHSKIVARHIENGVKITSTFQDIFIESINGDIQLSNRSGRVEICRVDAKNIIIENSFADIAVADCAGENVNILLKNGNLNFRDSRISNRMNIESQQANITLSMGVLTDPTFTIKTVRGRIFNHSAVGLEIFQEREECFANRSGQKPEIIINNHYGDIYLN